MNHATPHDHLMALLERQRQAHWDCPFPDVAQRLADLQALERLVSEHEAAMVQAINQDFGHRSRYETLMMEVAPVIAGIRHAQQHVRRWMRPQQRDVMRHLFGALHNQVQAEPLGVVGVIVPWNFPLMLSLSPLVSILAAGNRAILKYSEHSPHLTALLQSTMPHYFPEDKVAVVAETGGVGEALASLPLDHLIFTGSSQTARAVMRAAATHLTPLTLELGGKSPAIVAPDFDFELACESILFGKLLNAGQVCVNVDHVFVPAPQVASFVSYAQTVVMRWFENLDSPDYTSIIHAGAYERLTDMLAQAQARGAQIIPLLDSRPEHQAAHRLAPHLVLNAPEDCDLMQQEIFGPILPVIAYDDVHTLIKSIQKKDKPLALYPFTHDKELLQKILTHIQTGGVTVNDVLLHVAQEDLPFGGVGASGTGHYHGHDGFLNFSKLRPITHQARFNLMNLMHPPYRRMMSWMAWWARH